MRLLSPRRLVALLAAPAGALWCAAAPPPPPLAPAPTAVRLARDEPEILPRLGGRAGACDVLLFSPDGGTLLAAGDDKVVHRWRVGPAGLAAEEPARWNTFREQRGAIYALAVSPAHGAKRLALGGYGKLTSDVVIVEDSGRGPAVTGALSANSAAPTPYSGCGSAVWALAFDPAGAKLLVGHDDGSVWEFDTVAGRPDRPAVRAVAPALPGAAPADARVVWVGYAPGGGALFVRGSGEGFAAPPGGAAVPAFRVPGGRVKRAASSGDGKLLAATPSVESAGGSAVRLVSLPGGESAGSVPFARGRLPEAAALDANGSRLAVVVRDYAAGGDKPAFAHDPAGALEVYQLGAGGAKLAARAATPVVLDRVAFDPADKTRLAAAGGPEHATGLWRLDGDALKPLADDSQTRAGRAAWAVGVTEGGSHLCLRAGRNPTPSGPNDRGAGPWESFDLTKRTWAGAREPVPPLETLGGWRVAFDPADEFAWAAVEPGGARHPLPLDPARDDRPWCYTFVPNAGANGGPVRLAVGHYWGASLFELTPGRAPKRVRRFTGHAGAVVAIAPAFNGAGLVTAGRDLSVCLWSLADWPGGHPVFGAEFAGERDKLAVASVAPGSPAWEAGLSEGDEVKRLLRFRARSEELPPAGWRAALADPRPDEELAFVLARGDRALPAKTRVLHRPAARFFPINGSEWLLYRYREGTYDRSTNGDRYAGWLVSKPAAHLAPEFFPLERFEKFLRRPEKVAEILANLSANPEKVLLAELVPPQVVVEAQAPAADGSRQVAVTVTPLARPDGAANAVERVELWVGGHYRVASRQPAGPFAPGVPVRLAFDLPALALRPGLNELTAVAIGADMGYGSGRTSVSYAPPPGAPKPKSELYGLAVGITTYKGIGQRNLDCAAPDARLVAELLDGQKDARFDAVRVAVPHEEDATRETILATIREVKRRSGPEDVFVLFLSGHGANVTKRKPDGRLGWHLVIPREVAGADAVRQDAAAEARAWLSAEEIFAELRDMKAQPVVLLDSCHSGAAQAKAIQSKNLAREFRPYGLGPVVIAACGESERSFENSEYGHGFFTYHLKRSLTDDFADADQSGDGLLTAEELFGYLARRVPTDARRYDDPDNEGQKASQNPVLCPGAAESAGVIVAGRPQGAPGGAPPINKK